MNNKYSIFFGSIPVWVIAVSWTGNELKISVAK